MSTRQILVMKAVYYMSARLRLGLGYLKKNISFNLFVNIFYSSCSFSFAF